MAEAADRATQISTQPGTPQHARAVRDPASVGLLPALQHLLAVLVAALFFITFTVQPIRIPSQSMEPTLLVGDFLLLDKQAGTGSGHGLLPSVAIRRGDIVVFHDPVEDPSIHLVKRVVGLPGDRLHLRGGAVILNGSPLAEPYTVHNPAPPDLFRDDFPSLARMDADVDPKWWIALRTLVHGGDITVPPASYFVMGDNRNDSEDSRYWGFVPRADIVGEPVLVYFSLNPAQPGDSSTAHFNFARWQRTLRVIH